MVKLPPVNLSDSGSRKANLRHTRRGGRISYLIPMIFTNSCSYNTDHKHGVSFLTRIINVNCVNCVIVGNTVPDCDFWAIHSRRLGFLGQTGIVGPQVGVLGQLILTLGFSGHTYSEIVFCGGSCNAEHNGSAVELRTLDYENPGSNPGCGVKILGKFFHSTLLQFTQLYK